VKEVPLGIWSSSQNPLLTRLVLAAAIGFAGAVAAKMSDRGFAPRWLVVVAAISALGWMAYIFVSEMTRPSNKGRLVIRVFCGSVWSCLSLLIVVLTWTYASNILPDTALVYLKLRRPYIQSHWRADPVSKLSYFPLDYTTMDRDDVQPQNFVPRNFLVLDNAGTFLIDEYSNRLLSPSCSHAKYEARRLEDNIFVVRIYVDDIDEISIPCLVAPMPKEGNYTRFTPRPENPLAK
jgi:hypothetical protein